jgi:hypothetical protein
MAIEEGHLAKAREGRKQLVPAHLSFSLRVVGPPIYLRKGVLSKQRSEAENEDDNEYENDL